MMTELFLFGSAYVLVSVVVVSGLVERGKTKNNRKGGKENE